MPIQDADSWRQIQGVILAAVTMVLMMPAPAPAGVIARSGPRPVSLLEVYSSEGCSSCPPADHWVSRLEQDPGLWRDFVPVVFHVDYWDHLGWKDRFAQSRFTARQYDYADAWRRRQVYTPGFVLNGREWRQWGRSRSVPVADAIPSGELILDQTAARHWTVTFRPAPGSAPEEEMVRAYCPLGFGIASDVRAGENAGRNLQHNFIVLNFTEGPMTAAEDGTLRYEAGLDVPDTVPPRLGMAVWVSSSGHPAPRQAAGVYSIGKKIL